MNTVTYVYEHDPAAVIALLIDGDFITQRCKEMGEMNVNVKVRREGAQVIIENTRDVRRELPGFAKKIFKPVNRIHQVERWPDPEAEIKLGSYELEVRGAPVSISAQLRLAPHPRGSEYSVTFDIRARVPLIGKRIAKFTLDQTKEGLQRELDYTAGVLERRAQL